VCASCEEGLDSHDLSHVFEVLHKADFDWSNFALPKGVSVRIMRYGKKMPPRWYGNQFEGKVGVIQGVHCESDDKNGSCSGGRELGRNSCFEGATVYKVRFPGHRGSAVELPAEYLLPIFESRWQAVKVKEGLWREGMREPQQHHFSTESFLAVVAAEGALAACRHFFGRC